MIDTVLAGRYKITQELGKGGFGETYVAEDMQRMSRRCVVKHLKPDTTAPDKLQEAQRRFEIEAQTLAKLGQEHNQIPDLLDYFTEKGEFYLVQELIEGWTLAVEIKNKKQLTEIEVVQLLRDVLDALAYVHQEDVIHRDIKPSNLIRRFKDNKIVLVDFGIVKQTHAQAIVHQSQYYVGTPGYMPPEQAQSNPLPCSDIYALGMTSIEALTGRYPGHLPKDPETKEVLWENLVQVNPQLVAIINKMVCFYFRNRYQSATEILQALATIAYTFKDSADPSLPPFSGTQPESPPLPSTKPSTQVVLGLPPTIPDASPRPSSQPEQPLLYPKESTSPAIPVLPPTIPEAKPASEKSLDSFWADIFESTSGSQTNSPCQTRDSSVPIKFAVTTIDAYGRNIQQSEGRAEYFRQDLGQGVSLEMVKMPGGQFVMGSPRNKIGWISNEGRQHTVALAGFYIARFQITQSQWQAVMNNNPSHFKGDDRPVEQISWNDAREFCQRLSRLTERTYRLLTEAEWEYACRAGTNTPFNFGPTITPDLANYDGKCRYGSGPTGRYRQETTPVGSFPANAFGLYDMHGNVWEWCEDVWHENYQGAPLDGSAWVSGGDPGIRVLRGGSWNSAANSCRSAFRDGWNTTDRINNHGLRVALSLR